MRWKILATATLAVALAIGCSKTRSHISVSAKAGATGGTAAATGLDLGNGIVLSEVRIVVRKVEVEGSGCGSTSGTGADTATGGGTSMSSTPVVRDEGGTGSGSGSGSGDDSGSGEDQGDDDACEVEGGPFLADLDASDLAAGAITFVANMTVPDGTYKKVEFKIDTIPADKATSDGLTAMANLHASIAIDGTITDPTSGASTTFEFTTPMEVEREIEGTFTVDSTHPANLTLSIDPTGWFGGTGSARLDPNDPDARGAILEAIQVSIRLVHDDDKDGCDDEHADPSCPTETDAGMGG